MAESPNLFAYLSDSPTNGTDPFGCAFVDCKKALYELKDAIKDLKDRLADNAAHPYDSNHEKSIQQARNRALNAVKIAAKHCKLDPDTLADLAALGITLAVLILLLTLAPEALIGLLPALAQL